MSFFKKMNALLNRCSYLLSESHNGNDKTEQSSIVMHGITKCYVENRWIALDIMHIPFGTNWDKL